MASAEISFSKLKMAKFFLRNTVGQCKLSLLAIISIENQIARSLDVSNLVSTCAHWKARKKQF